MRLEEVWAIAHIDISPRSSLDEGVGRLSRLAEVAASERGMIALAVLRQPVRQNHFELVGRFASDADYVSHLCGEHNRAFREAIAPTLGAPYEDRIHRGNTPDSLPATSPGDFVVVTQLELFPKNESSYAGALKELANGQRDTDGMRGNVVLERRERPNNVEIISVWSGEEAFEAHLGDPASLAARANFADWLVAPIDDRRHHLLVGELSVR